MKKYMVLGALVAVTLATAVPAEALSIRVGPRGVGVGVGHRGFVGRGRAYRRPFVHRRIVRGRRFRRF